MKKNCGTCKYWTKTSNYGCVTNDGECKEIREKITIELCTGWDGGYVDYIETEEDFCCSLYERLDFQI